MFDPQIASLADKIVRANREGWARQLVEEIYADDCLSIEAADPNGKGRETAGKAAILAKHDQWEQMAVVHDLSVEGPFHCGDDKIAVIYAMDVTFGEGGTRSQLREIGIYTIADGQVVREEFFYERPEGPAD